MPEAKNRKKCGLGSETQTNPSQRSIVMPQFELDSEQKGNLARMSLMSQALAYSNGALTPDRVIRIVSS
jgi:hypothetical protein